MFDLVSLRSLQPARLLCHSLEELDPMFWYDLLDVERRERQDTSCGSTSGTGNAGVIRTR